MCAFIISSIILFIGVELGISSIKKIIHPEEIEFNYIMIIILVFTIFIKLWMSFFYTKTSKKINSLSLKAAARDSFNDVITTLFITIGLFIGKISDMNLDGYIGILVCIYILISGIH